MSQTLSYSTTLDRDLVHRRAVAEVFLTDSAELAINELQFAAQWPARHVFFKTEGDLDLLLVAETLRQVTIAAAHLYYRVPRNYKFVMAGLDVAAISGAQKTFHHAVTDLLVRVVIDGVKQRPSGVEALVAHHVFYRDGQPFATGRGDLTIVDDRVYRRLRSGASSSDSVEISSVAPADPAAVGEGREEDIALGHQQHDGSWLLRIVPDHGVHFDHPSDHVPGMLLFAAAVQAVRATTGRPQAGFSSMIGRFSRYVELNQPVWIAPNRADDRSDVWQVAISQGGRVAAMIELRLL